MRLSTYEIILPLLDKYRKEISDYRLMVNGLYGSYDIISKKDCEKISAGKFSELPLALLERLLLRGHITRKSESEEFADMKLLSRLSKKIYDSHSIGLAIIPTYDCNFRCPYCYEQHLLSKGKDWLSQTMSDEMIEAVFSALKNYKDRGYDVDQCTFYGGEPLLEKNLPVVRKIAQHCRELGITMTATTNGYDLDKYIDLLSEFNFKQIQVTVDGVGFVNDRLRVHKDGVSTYEQILANAERALELGIQVSIRVNVDSQNIHGMKDLINDLKARGFINKVSDVKAKTKRGEFKYYFLTKKYFKGEPLDFKFKNTIVSKKDIFDELIKIGFTVEDIFQLESNRGISKTLKALFRKKSFASFSPSYCGAECGMTVIDPFGKIFSCYNYVGKDDKVVGLVDTKNGRFLWNLNKAKWKIRTVDIMEKCQTCPYCFICKGGCASRAEYNTGNCFREDCAQTKEYFNFVAAYVAGTHWQKHHEQELSLSLAEPLSRLTTKERETIMTTKSQKELFEIVKAIGFMPENVQEEYKLNEAKHL